VEGGRAEEMASTKPFEWFCTKYSKLEGHYVFFSYVVYLQILPSQGLSYSNLMAISNSLM